MTVVLDLTKGSLMPRVKTSSIDGADAEADKAHRVLGERARERKALLREYGRAVRDLRKAGRFTLGVLSYHTGIGLMQLSAIERGRAPVTLWQMFQIARALGKHPASLLPVALPPLEPKKEKKRPTSVESDREGSA